MSITGSFLRAVAPQILVAIFVIVVLAVIEDQVLQPSGAIDWLFHHLGATGSTAVPPGVDAASSARAWNASSYDYVLSTLAQVAGVFIGLYFTAVNLVASTIYARVPSDIRAMVVGEKIGNVYVKIVALLAAVATILLVCNTLGVPPRVLHLGLVGLLGLVSIYSFLILGKRVFQFFDPTRLAADVFAELIRCIDRVTPRGYMWDDPSFQAHAQRRAETLIETYERIVGLTCSSEYRHIEGTSLAELATGACALLRVYGGRKSQIPIDSQWFKRRPQEHNWLTANHTRIDIALKTSTAVEPQLVPDPLWFERRVLAVAVRLFTTLVTRGDYLNAGPFVLGCQQALDGLGQDWAMDEGFFLFDTIEGVFQAHATDALPPPENWAADQDKPRFAIALSDAVFLSVISLLLGFSRRLEFTTAESFAASIEQISWDRPRSVYDATWPRPIVAQLESLRRGLDFELASEGRWVTPIWYRVQFAHQGLMRLVAESMEKLTAMLESLSRTGLETASGGQTVLAAQAINRGLEACHKFRTHFESFRGRLDQLAALRRAQDVPCHTVDFDSYLCRVAEVRTRLLAALGKLSVELSRLPTVVGVPDYFGQAYAILMTECYAAMHEGNEEQFRSLFPPLLMMALDAHERLRDELAVGDAVVGAIIRTEPLIDLMALSGFAILYTELGGKSYRAVALHAWDAFLADHTRPQEVLQALNAMLRSRERGFMAGPRILLRTEWQLQFQQLLAREGLTEEGLPFARVIGEKVRAHPSRLIRALARHFHMHERAEEVFAAIYLVRHPRAGELELTRGARQLAQLLASSDGSDDPRKEDA